jgi:hypothetical protein
MFRSLENVRAARTLRHCCVAGRLIALLRGQVIAFSEAELSEATGTPAEEWAPPAAEE